MTINLNKPQLRIYLSPNSNNMNQKHPLLVTVLTKNVIKMSASKELVQNDWRKRRTFSVKLDDSHGDIRIQGFLETN
jgi:hypothetical protein